MKKMIFVAALAAVCACKKKAPEQIPQPKAAETAAVSTAAPSGMLAAPGNYLKTTVGHIGEAKAAAALYEKTAKDSLGAAAKAGGN